jgi:hypothetical protein
MNIGLITDGKMPNLSLMKISNFHKSKGDSVEWLFPILKYDIVYISKLFKFSNMEDIYIYADKIIKGGTGYDEKIKLPYEI